jgi:hypothetical protein
LNLLISPVLLRGTIVISSPCWSMTCTVVSPSSTVTVWPCVANADLDALPGNLDAAAAGHLPLDRRPRSRERIWPGQADALDPVPLAGRDGAGKGAPQDAVLGNDVHDLAVQADAGSLPG